ncbi:MAG: TrkA C-terminal domain-containing protein [Acidimicrobiia bacterium]
MCIRRSLRPIFAIRSLHSLSLPVSNPGRLLEAKVGADSPLAWTVVSEAPWPAGSLAVSLDRHGHLFSPTPETELQPDDVVVVVASSAAGSEVRRLLVGEVPSA